MPTPLRLSSISAHSTSSHFIKVHCYCFNSRLHKNLSFKPNEILFRIFSDQNLASEKPLPVEKARSLWKPGKPEMPVDSVKPWYSEIKA